MKAELAFPLVGAGGEPVDLWRTFNSHGMTDLPPFLLHQGERALEMTVRPQGRTGPDGPARTVVVRDGMDGSGRIAVAGRAPAARVADGLIVAVRHVLRMDQDLSGFYAKAARDPDLGWATRGAGRMVRGQTVFEDVVKTICTTNCTWSATTRMVLALVEHLGERAPGAPADGWRGRAFPTPSEMAEAPEAFYRDVVRAGYRAAYLRTLAAAVTEGRLDLEALGRGARDELSDDEVAARLLELQGVGPYAAAHVMMTLGRNSRLILDSWTRPTYARLVGRKTVADAAIERRFRRYGDDAGLAFWLFLTRDWVQEADRPVDS